MSELTSGDEDPKIIEEPKEHDIAGVKVKVGDKKTFVFKKDYGYSIESVTGTVDSFAVYADGHTQFWVNQGMDVFDSDLDKITHHNVADIAEVRKPPR